MTTTLVNKLRQVKTKSNHSYSKMSAVVLKKGKPISFGFNFVESNYQYKEKHCLKKWHSEMNALLKVKNKETLKNCTIVIFREDKMGNFKLAKPCSLCEELIRSFGLKKMVYTTEMGWMEENI